MKLSRASGSRDASSGYPNLCAIKSKWSNAFLYWDWFSVGIVLDRIIGTDALTPL